MSHRIPKKIDLRPKKHHGWTGLIVLFGFFVPPLAVALRFGIGTDFFINVILCICGYIPSHGHNFYIQNIRNNTGKNRTPKWAKKLGLVDDTEELRRARKSQWARRYNERNHESSHVNAELAEGEEGANYVPEAVLTEEEINRRRREGLWTREDEEYYNEERDTSNHRHWHYPANFEDADVANGPVDPDAWKATNGSKKPGFSLGRKGNKSKNRDNIASYAPSGPNYSHDNFDSSNGNGNARNSRDNERPWDATYDDDVPEWGRDYGAPKNKKKGGNAAITSGLGRDNGYGDYGNSNGNGNANGNGKVSASVGGGRRQVEENWDHQF